MIESGSGVSGASQYPAIVYIPWKAQLNFKTWLVSKAYQVERRIRRAPVELNLLFYTAKIMAKQLINRAVCFVFPAVSNKALNLPGVCMVSLPSRGGDSRCTRYLREAIEALLAGNYPRFWLSLRLFNDEAKREGYKQDAMIPLMIDGVKAIVNSSDVQSKEKLRRHIMSDGSAFSQIYRAFFLVGVDQLVDSKLCPDLKELYGRCSDLTRALADAVLSPAETWQKYLSDLAHGSDRQNLSAYTGLDHAFRRQCVTLRADTTGLPQLDDPDSRESGKRKVALQRYPFASGNKPLPVSCQKATGLVWWALQPATKIFPAVYNGAEKFCRLLGVVAG